MQTKTVLKKLKSYIAFYSMFLKVHKQHLNKTVKPGINVTNALNTGSSREQRDNIQ